MSRIRILPDHVANQIAAGEVVERPASVVKELVENALDAGASRVDVALRNGGKTRIRVADDGSGMDRTDALLALDRHATSKIRSVDELRGVASFGFRGEALPSIAAVSRFDLETAPVGGGAGTHVRVVAGRVLSAKEIARQAGTTVTVRSLFQNVPARAKFLRSAAVETRAVSEAVVLLSLAHLGAAIRLESNGRELLDLPPAGTLAERIAAIWGEEEAEELLAIDEGANGIRIDGLIQRPDAARAAGGRRYLLVNGRPFRDPGLLRVVDAAYRTTVAPGLRPSVFLRLGVEPDAVDVNVHPAKAEVRFRDRVALVETLEAGIRRRLGAVSSTPGFGSSGVSRAAPGRPSPGASLDPGTGPAAEVREAPQLAFFVPGAAEIVAGVAADPDREPAGGAGGAAAAEVTAGRPGLWQLHSSYILAATREGLIIIDQHSAHERILYEEIMGRFTGGEGSVSQRLLFPLTLRLAPAELAAVDELGGLLSRVGFEVEAFGDRTVIVRSAPNPHPYFDAEACFRGMIEELAHGSDLVNSARNQHERIAKSLACKAAIKAGQPLSEDEMVELFDRLFATELPGHDVHGRPTILRLTLDELARRFGRA